MRFPKYARLRKCGGKAFDTEKCSGGAAQDGFLFFPVETNSRKDLDAMVEECSGISSQSGHEQEL